MDINNNTNISNQIAQSISKLNLNTAQRAFEASKKENTSEVEKEAFKQEDISLINEKEAKTQASKRGNNQIDVADIQKYANYMGENLSIDDINYGLMYGRSVIADYLA